MAKVRGGMFWVLAGTVLASMFTGPTARGFSFLDFPTQGDVDAGRIYRWGDGVPGDPIVLTYAIADDFLAGEDAETRANAEAAIVAALDSWTSASRGMLRFERAGWGAVANEGALPPAEFVGPPLQEWLDWFNAGRPDPPLPDPGWGAHIDFLSAPQGYTVTFGGVTYQITGCNLGFMAAYRDGATGLRSVDIYLSEKWDWTTDAADVTPFGPIEQALQPLLMGVGVARDAEADPTSRGGDRTGGRSGCSGLNLVVDIETVVVHEVGHAIGLDHPDEATSAGSPSLEAYTFQPEGTGLVFEGRVMYSLYEGLKRELTEDEVGAVAFLYPPALPGDVDADGDIDVTDAVRTLDLFEGRIPADPWIVNRLDFNTRNGVVEADEVRQVLLWVLDPENNPPGIVPSAGPVFFTPELSGASSIEVLGRTEPEDVGVGGEIELVLEISNQDLVALSGWEIHVRYDSAIFSNPVRDESTEFLSGGVWAPFVVTEPSPGVGQIKLTRIGFGVDSSASGVLARVRFDIDLIAAAAVPEVTFELFNVDLVADDPFAHNYGENTLFPDETLIVTDIVSPAYQFDVDGNGVFDVEDAYSFNASPSDVDNNGMVEAYDRWALFEYLRRLETEDVAPGRIPGPPLPPAMAE